MICFCGLSDCNFLAFVNRSAFSMNIPNLPMQLLAITDNGGANAFFNNDLCQMLITEGNAIADKLRAHFMTSAIGNQLKCKYLISMCIQCALASVLHITTLDVNFYSREKQSHFTPHF